MAHLLQHWFHLLATTLWIGPQIFLVLVFLPALRAVDDPLLRRRAMLVMATRFNVLAWAVLVVLIVTGVLNALERVPSLTFLFTTRYGLILSLKSLLVVGIVVLTAVHGFVLGPRLLSYPVEADPHAVPELRRLQRRSILVSAANLLLGLLVLACVVLLRG